MAPPTTFTTLAVTPRRPWQRRHAWAWGTMLVLALGGVGLVLQHQPMAQANSAAAEAGTDSTPEALAEPMTAEESPTVSTPPAPPAPTTAQATHTWAAPQLPVVITVSTPTFDGKPLRVARTVRMLVTAYCPGPCCCGPQAHGVTASGKSVETNAMHLVAAPPAWRLGTIVTIPGYDQGSPVPVLDRGGRIKGSRLDVLMPTHAQAQAWGARWLEVTVWEYAE